MLVGLSKPSKSSSTCRVWPPSSLVQTLVLGIGCASPAAKHLGVSRAFKYTWQKRVGCREHRVFGRRPFRLAPSGAPFPMTRRAELASGTLPVRLRQRTFPDVSSSLAVCLASATCLERLKCSATEHRVRPYRG